MTFVLRAAGLALGLALVAVPVAAQDGLKRLTLRQDLLGWEGVGRLDLGQSGQCTGVLIAADTVLTAGHCLVDRARGGWIDPGGIRFRAGFRDGVAIAERGVRQGAVHPDYDPAHPDGAARLAHDVALLTLDEPIPTATARPFLTSTPPAGRSVSVVSYGQGRMEALSRQGRCNVLGRERGVMAFDCDGAPGSSGAPVFEIDGNRIRIVSMIVAGTRSGGQRVSLGPELDRAVEAVRREMRAGRGLWPGAASTGARFVRP